MKITLDEILEAQKQCGLKIGQCITYAGNCGCPITILCVAKEPSVDPYESLTWADNIYGSIFVSGFISGFDFPGSRVNFTDEDYKEGYENGQYIYSGLNKLGLLNN